jgi:cytoskeletal protein CcmA (bactofilin family)
MWKRDESGKPPSTQQDPSVEAAPIDSRFPGKVVMDLGKSIVIKGELSASEDLTLYGQMEGSVRLPHHALTIGPNADINAEIAAKTVVIMGAVTGNVTAGEKVEIRNTGFVTGNIVAPRLAIADGGGLRGKVEMSDSRAGQQAKPSL